MILTVGVSFILISFAYSIGLNVLFFSKKHVKNYETRLFSVFLPANFFGLLLEFCCSLAVGYYGITNTISVVLSKVFLIYLLFFLLLLLLYVYVICGSKDTVVELTNKQIKTRNIFIVLFIIVSIVDFLLPIQLKDSNGAMYSSGKATTFVYVISAIACLYCFVIFIMNTN